ncbi:anti-sigma factor [Paucibacter sediminis]|uniref:Anti-sigma factor n=1 Tax=Paucibacter sediminis TaxID=3019553 RepID=A0AA95SR67_9BURK|nr:anti-sigma factor [Paucibacter sp. S2-9]WIT14360.1 anti-sigma factor [Paucibacter sp. S2-9]
MDYSRPRLAEKLAAEYALGTLRGPARRRFEQLLPAHPALAREVARWQLRLQALASPVAAVQPPAQLWPAIQRRLFGAPQPAPRWWQRLSLWQGFSGTASALALTALLLLNQPQPVQPPLVIVMNSTAEGADLVKAGFVASVSADGQALVLKPLGPLTLAQGRALELWAVPAQGAPRSLGLVAGNSATTVLRTKLLQNTAAFAVSLEPGGGSPTGAPTGPIVSAGRV